MAVNPKKEKTVETTGPIRLSDGSIVVLRRPRGREMEAASKQKTRVGQSYSLIALCSVEDPTVNAKVLTYQQILDLPLDDIDLLSNALVAVKKGKQFDQDLYELEQEEEEDEDL